MANVQLATIVLPPQAEDIDTNFKTLKLAIEGSGDLTVRNVDTTLLAKGTPVYLAGGDGVYPVVLRAKADAAATMPAIGLAAENIAPDSLGPIRTNGTLTGIDTTAWTSGADLYVSAATAGVLTSTAPSTFPQIVANVLLVGEQGQLTLNVQSSGETHTLLSAVHTDTTVGTVARGDLIIGQGASATWTRLALGTAGKVPRSDGTDLPYSTFTIPDTFTLGDVIYASAANVLTALATSASATRYLSNTGVSNIPAWAQVNLTNGVTGTLPVGNGGTNNTTFTAYAVLCAGTTGTGAFQNVSGLGTSGYVLTSNGVSTLPTWQAAPGAAHALLSATHSDTTAQAVSRGSLIYGDLTPTWNELVV